MDFFNKLTEFAGGNQFIAGAMSMWILGVLTYLARNIPQSIYNVMRRHLTTTITISSAHRVYYMFHRLLNEGGYPNRVRTFAVMNRGRMYSADSYSTIMKTVGYGSHIMLIGKVPVLFSVYKDEANQTADDKETITLTKFGRSHKLFDKFISELELMMKPTDRQYMRMFKATQDSTDEAGVVRKRSMDTVILPDDVRDKLINSIKEFQGKEQWYIERGIPYQLGIMLYGPPGTGKSSVVKALATEFNMNIIYVAAAEIHTLHGANLAATANDVIVIEDIDTSISVKKRKDTTKHESTNDISEFGNKQSSATKKLKKFIEDQMTRVDSDDFGTGAMAELAGMGLSDLLNQMDGLMSKHGRVMIMTTNKIDDIDSALLRPGRVDVMMEIPHVNDEMFSKFIKLFFNADVDMKVKEGVSMADLQGKFLEGHNLDYFLINYTKGN